MKIHQPSPDLLIVESLDNGFTKLCLVGFLLMLVIGVFQLYRQPLGWESEQVHGALAGCGFFALLFVLFFERVRFVFDRRIKLIVWRRRRALRAKGGEVTFSSVVRILVNVPIGDQGHPPNRQIILKLKEGVLPLTVTTTTDVDDVQLHLAERLRQFMGEDPREPAQSAIDEAIAAGQIIQAVKLLREHDGLSLLDAKLRVSEIEEELRSR